jgi:ABC-2 type transport system ATP-binding protein
VRGIERLYKLECEPESDPRESIFRAAVENGWILLEMSEERASLEDIFVRLTTQEEVP